MTNGPRRRSPSAASEVSSPVPVETPARFSVGGTSQSWLQKGTPSTTRSSSPCTSSNRPDEDDDDEVEDDEEEEDEEDADGDEVTFNPRRFTPTLHASLVSEILNLRREVDGKARTIDTLERNLDESRTECEDVSSNLSRCSKEARSLRHQLDLLEGGSSSALTELAKERDDALESVAEMRKKLEYSQKKSRSREEDVDRTQVLWDREREAWDMEKRSLERKIHIVENRLKTVLNEVAMAQAAAAGSSPLINNNNNNYTATTFFDDNDDGSTPRPEDAARDISARDSDTASNYSASQGHRRQISMASTSTNGNAANRYSVVSMAYRHHGGGPGSLGDNGVNLAQELDFDNDEFDTLVDDPLIDESSPEALPEERPVSAHSQLSQTMGAKARKVLGLGLQDRASSTDSDAPTEIPSPGATATRPSTMTMAFVYHDMGVQYSPPPSPTEPTPTLSPTPVTTTSTSSASTITTKDSATCTPTTDMVSSACQTIGDLPSPPWTPKIDKTDASFASFSSASLPSSPAVVAPAIPSVPMVSSFTQTEGGVADQEAAGDQGQFLCLSTTSQEEPRMSLSPRDALSPPAPSGPGTGPGMEVPMIAIHPPGSEPPSPRGSVVLPPQTKSIACQTEREDKFAPVQGRSIAIQTEGIRVDPRRMKLPASLLPSAIPNLPLANEASRSSSSTTTTTTTTTKEPKSSSPPSVSSLISPPAPQPQTRADPVPPAPTVAPPTVAPPTAPPIAPPTVAPPAPPSQRPQPSLSAAPPPPLSIPPPPPPPSYSLSLPPEEQPPPPPSPLEKELPLPRLDEKELPLPRSDKELPQLPVIETSSSSSRQETIQEEDEEDEERPGLPPKPFETIGHIQAYPGNNDNGPLTTAPTTKKLVKPAPHNMRRPPRSSSLFAGFDDDEEEKPRESMEKKPGAASAAATGRDIFNDDDLFNRPTATYTLRKGKMVSTPAQSNLDSTTLPEIEEHLSDAKMQLLNPDSDQPPQPDPVETMPSSRFGGMRSASGPRQQQQNIRRAAMITNGAAAHQRNSRSHNSNPSTDSGSNKSTTTSIAPPIPVPKRHSSRQFPSATNSESGSNSGKTSVSDRSRAPTTTSTRRSAATATAERKRSTTTNSQGSQPDPYSPAMTMSSSHGTAAIEGPPPFRPELPWDNNMPDPSVHAPRPQEYKRHSAWREIPVYEDPEPTEEYDDDVMGRERQDSTTTSIQQTSVVDAIAQTMVGEWMFKYIRRRSFTSGDKDNWEGRNAEEVSASITNTGMRHKRWVWLAPYERAIMWSNKQPSGSALLGKGGRKLLIKNVLDVKDDNPLPKGSSPQSQFNRSILVLTPQRALKFTAMSVDRHFVWLTALSFLSHSTLGMDELAIIPPIPQGDREERPVSPASASSTRKSNVIRKPKSKQSKLSFGSKKSKSSQDDFLSVVPPVPSINDLDTIDGDAHNGNTVDDDDGDDRAASPPTVPMFKQHARKRSNTAPRLGAGTSTTGFSATVSSSSPRPGAVRNFSSFGPSTMSMNGIGGGGGGGSSGPPSLVGSIDAFYPPPPIPTSPVPMSPMSFSRRPSEATSRRPSETASCRPSESISRQPSQASRSSSRAAGGFGGGGGNTLTSTYSYTDSVGTARMEAFIAQTGAGVGASSMVSSRRPSSSMRRGMGGGSSSGNGHYRKTSSLSAAGTAVTAQPEDFIVGFENFSETSSDPFRNF